MKLKNIRALGLSICLSTMVLNSCNESNLELSPLTPLEGDYFSDQAEFERGVLGIYAKMTDFFSWNGGQSGNDFLAALWHLPGDDMTTAGTGSASLDFENFQSLTDGNNVVRNYYSVAYQMISRSNVVLEKIEEVEPDVYQDPALKNYHKGEALFLRGYVYWNLWNFFGSAPISIERITSTDQMLLEPSEGNQLLDQAIADFTEAATLLPTNDVWGDTNRGRATRNSAYGMLGKALVFRGTVTSNSADFTAALAAFNAITGVALVSDFSDNFSAFEENNIESLFEFQAGEDPGENIWLPNDFQPVIKAMSVGCWVPFTNTNNWQYGGSPFIATEKLISSFEPGDPRLELTVNPADKRIRKYVTNDQTVLGGASSVNNPRILRYADVLLLKAEAIVRSGGSKAEAIALLNEVRQRARAMSDTGVPADRNASETDAATILGWIADERFIELAFEEGARWMDLRRYHMANEVVLDNSFFSSVNTGFNFDASKNLLFPIPQVELNRNPLMRQNPGY